MVNIWVCYDIECIDTRSCFDKLKLPKLELDEEAFWCTEAGMQSGFECLCYLYETTVKNGIPSALIVTFHPDKTFLVLVDKMGNQMLMDFHVHRCSYPFEEAVKNPSLLGLWALAARNDWEIMLKFILNELSQCINAKSTTGCISKVTYPYAKKLVKCSDSDKEDLQRTYCVKLERKGLHIVRADVR